MNSAVRFTSRDHEQDRRQVDERRDLDVRHGPLVLLGELARERVSRHEQRPVNAVAGADHLGDGDRLADRAAQAEQNRRAHTGARVRKDDPAHHLPARGPERQRALLELGRHAEEELAADARGDRDDHDRQDEHGDQHPGVLGRAAEERDEAEMAVEPGLEILADERPENEDSPETEHDARDRREQLDERGDHGARPARCQLAQIEPDRDRGGVAIEARRTTSGQYPRSGPVPRTCCGPCPSPDG